MEAKDWLVIVGLGITIFLGVLNIFLNRKTRYVNTVTTERVKWIEKLRGNVATFMNLINIIRSNARDEKEDVAAIHEAAKIQSLIVLMLNIEGQQEKKIIEATKVMLEKAQIYPKPPTDVGQYMKELSQAHGDLETATRALLKEEWEKVKRESKKLL